MNLNTIEEVKRPSSTEEITEWRDGYAWLAGGTWLFSEPQIADRTLIDLEALGWPPLQASARGWTSPRPAASSSSTGSPRRRNGRGAAHPRMLPRLPGLVQDLEHGHRRRQHLHVACPPGPMISLTVAWKASARSGRAARRARRAGRRLRHGRPCQRAAAGRVAAQHPAAGRGAGEARRVPPHLAHPAGPLRRAADRHRAPTAADLLLTVTAATAAAGAAPLDRRRPPTSCAARSTPSISAGDYFDDVHGSPAYRRHLTYYYRRADSPRAVAPERRT